MGHPNMHSWAHSITPGWMPKTKSLEPHVEEPGELHALMRSSNKLNQ